MTTEAAAQLSDASTVGAPLRRIIKAIAWVGLGVGVARIINGAFSIWESNVFADEPWIDPVHKSPFLVIGGLLAILLGGALITASIGCLKRQPWAWVLFMLVEQCAILLLVVAQLAAIAKYTPEILKSYALLNDSLIELADAFTRLMMPSAYSILAIVIMRTRIARAFFNEEAEAEGSAVDVQDDTSLWPRSG